METIENIGFTFGIDEDAKILSLMAYNGDSDGTDLAIPSLQVTSTNKFFGDTIYPVTKIAEKAFYGNAKLVRIELPATIQSLENFAFGSCSNLERVYIPRSVTHIGDGAFFGCGKLQTIEIPQTVTTIGNTAFDEATTLLVHDKSFAHAYAKINNLQFELVE